MSTSNISTNTIEIEKAIAMVGDVHTLCIVHNLGGKEMRFNELQRVTENGINPTTLSNRLKKLEKDGFIYRKEETLDKISVVYGLTEKGQALLPVINEITKFASKYSK